MGINSKGHGRTNEVVAAAWMLSKKEFVAGSMMMRITRMHLSGEPVWSADTSAGVISVAGDVSRNSVCVSTGSGEVLNLDLSGKKRWGVHLNSPVWNIIPTSKGFFVADTSGVSSALILYTHSGERKKNIPLPDNVRTVSGSYSGAVFALTTERKEFILIDSEGDELDMGDEPESDWSYLAPDARTLVVSNGSLLHYYRDWRHIWAKNLGAAVGKAMLSPTGNRCFAQIRRSIVCFDSTGSILWTWTDPTYSRIACIAPGYEEDLLVFSTSGEFVLLG